MSVSYALMGRLWPSLSNNEALNVVLEEEEISEIVEFFEILLSTGHTVREALQGIESVWAQHR